MVLQTRYSNHTDSFAPTPRDRVFTERQMGRESVQSRERPTARNADLVRAMGALRFAKRIGDSGRSSLDGKAWKTALSNSSFAFIGAGRILHQSRNHPWPIEFTPILSSQSKFPFSQSPDEIRRCPFRIHRQIRPDRNRRHCAEPAQATLPPKPARWRVRRSPDFHPRTEEGSRIPH